MSFIWLICEEILTNSNSILKNGYPHGLVKYYASGSSSQIINGTLQKTKPEYAFDQINKNYDWCSNCGHSSTDFPWLILEIKDQIMKLNGYYLKAGCCSGSSAGCCCYESASYCCYCCLFSWSLQVSNDNTAWKTVHKVEKDYDMAYCKEKTYKFSETHEARYVRLIQDESCPGDPPCIAINKIELIGTTNKGMPLEDFFSDNEEDDVSIIGHIAKNHAN